MGKPEEIAPPAAVDAPGEAAGADEVELVTALGWGAGRGGEQAAGAAALEPRPVGLELVHLHRDLAQGGLRLDLPADQRPSDDAPVSEPDLVPRERGHVVGRDLDQPRLPSTA